MSGLIFLILTIFKDTIIWHPNMPTYNIYFLFFKSALTDVCFSSFRWSWTGSTACTSHNRRCAALSTLTLAVCSCARTWKKVVMLSSQQPLTLDYKQTSCYEPSQMCLQSASNNSPSSPLLTMGYACHPL